MLEVDGNSSGLTVIMGDEADVDEIAAALKGIAVSGHGDSHGIDASNRAFHSIEDYRPALARSEIPLLKHGACRAGGCDDEDAVRWDYGPAEIQVAIDRPRSTVDADEAPSVQAVAGCSDNLGEDIIRIRPSSVVEDFVDAELGRTDLRHQEDKEEEWPLNVFCRRLPFRSWRFHM